MTDNPKTRYPGQAIDVEWDERLCIHIGECGQAEGNLFVGGRQPWCQPDLANPNEVIDIVERCPSGALTWARKEQDTVETPDGSNTVTVSYCGPYFARGDLAIEGAADDMPGVAFRAALCRCGASGNKPFCDNSHEKIGFRDYGAVGQRGERLDSEGGKLEIKPLSDGPLLVSGNLRLMNSSGRIAWQGTQAALCRCGASKNKPFCDGSHKAAGFKG